MKHPIQHFIKEEKSGIKDYEDSEKASSKHEKKAYKKIVPEEKKHLRILKKTVANKMK